MARVLLIPEATQLTVLLKAQLKREERIKILITCPKVEKVEVSLIVTKSEKEAGII
jgi:hypothetical protein